MRGAYKIAIVIIAIVVLLGAMGLYLRNAASSLQNLNFSSSNQSASGPVSITASAAQSQVFNYNNSLAVYSLVSYRIANATNATATISLYQSNPFERIYLLNVSDFCVSCFDENALRSALQSSLLNYDLIRNGTSFNYINMSALGSIPAGSAVIIPSGLIPIFLLNGTSPSLLDLLQNGDTVVYAGLNFSRSIGPDGLIFVNNLQTMDSLAAAGLATQPTSSSPFSTAENLSFSKPSFSFLSGFRYGNVTYANSGTGTMIAFSNYPTSSWRTATAMANDIASVLNARFWMPQMGSSQTLLNTSAKSTGSIGLFTQVVSPVKQNLSRFNATLALAGSFALVTMSASNKQSSSIKEFGMQNVYHPKGSVSIAASVGESQNIPILIQISNASQNLLVHLDLYDRNLSYVGSIPIGFVSGSLGVVKYHAFQLPSGYYIAQLKDFNNNYYGSAIFNLTGAVITPTSLDFKNGVFLFTVYSNGLPVTNTTYTVDLNGLFSSSGSISNGVLNYTLPPGTLVGYGTETFNFYMFNTHYSYVSPYQQGAANIPPIYIELGIVIIVVVLLNLILKPPNRDEYYIDVPEFPPSKREKVRVPKSSVLGIFDKVNYYHRWKYMPLTADEVKMGIGNNIRANNMPISITTQNANSILSRLVSDRSLVGMSDYYAPAAWIEASGHSIEYLITFRKLRDYCVSHAILFTDIDSNDSADMLITRESKQMSIYIYSEGTKMKKMSLSSGSKAAIVFLNDDSVKSFTEKLYAAYGSEAELLKLSIEYNYVKLVDSDHLDQLVF